MSGGDVIGGGNVGAIVFDADCIAFVAMVNRRHYTMDLGRYATANSTYVVGLNGINVGIGCQCWRVNYGRFISVNLCGLVRSTLGI